MDAATDLAGAERKMRRGHKSADHLEVLRQSDPTYGTLAPALTRPGRAEHPYEPTRRFHANLVGPHPLSGGFLDSCWHHCGMWGQVRRLALPCLAMIVACTALN